MEFFQGLSIDGLGTRQLLMLAVLILVLAGIAVWRQTAGSSRSSRRKSRRSQHRTER